LQRDKPARTAELENLEICVTSDRGFVAVLIVAFGRPNEVCLCLSALAKASPETPFHVFVCENAGEAAFTELNTALTNSSGPCREYRDERPFRIEPSERLAEVRCMQLGERSSSVWTARATHNLGYAGAINALIDWLKFVPTWKGVWVLNPDTEPEPRALTELVERSDIGGKGMVGSTIVSDEDNGFIHVRSGMYWNPFPGRAKSIGKGHRVGDTYDTAMIEAKLDAPSGASMYVTRECLGRIGPMDERFFLYYEDVDWGVRAKPFGLGYAAASIVRHKGGTTLGSATYRHSNRSSLAVFLASRNRIHFVRKHYPFWLGPTYLFSLIYALRYLVNGSWKDCKVAIEGIVSASKGEIGPPTQFLPADLIIQRPNITRIPLHRTRIAIGLIFYLVNVAVKAMYRLVGQPAGQQLTIVYYHSVHPDFLFEFRRQMQDLSRWAHVVPANFHGSLPTQKVLVALTFDDAFTSVNDNAIPELRARSFPCAIFVPVSHIGKSPTWYSEDVGATFQETVMTEAQLTSLSPTIVTLGSHGMTHPYLTRLNAADAQFEIGESRQQLQKLIGRDVRLIAVPYGDINARVAEICCECGYDYVFTTIPESIEMTTSPNKIRGRIRVDPWDGPLEYFLKCNGAYGWRKHVGPIIHSVRYRLSTLLNQTRGQETSASSE
jgi:N-acetylglucosaminyl-diphospho-decaprenol L-rhamnosyltransferase